MTNEELIQKIRAEIERLKKCNHRMADIAINSNMRNFYDGEEDCCKQLLSFLDTLEEPVSDDLEEEVKRYLYEECSGDDEPAVSEIACHFAEWQKAKMMKGAVEGEVCGRVYDHINVRFADGVCKYLEPKNISHIPADVSKYNIGDKVKIIIVKEEEQ